MKGKIVHAMGEGGGKSCRLESTRKLVQAQEGSGCLPHRSPREWDNRCHPSTACPLAQCGRTLTGAHKAIWEGTKAEPWENQMEAVRAA